MSIIWDDLHEGVFLYQREVHLGTSQEATAWGNHALSALSQELTWVQCCFLCTDAARHKKCFNNITGYCRKRCEVGEIYEIACLNGKLCCVNEGKNKKYKKVEELLQPSMQSDQELDYVVLPTVTLLTTQSWVKHLLRGSPRFLNQKCHLIQHAETRDLSTSFCQLDSPHNKVLCFSLDLLINVFIDFFELQTWMNSYRVLGIILVIWVIYKEIMWTCCWRQKLAPSFSWHFRHHSSFESSFLSLIRLECPNFVCVRMSTERFSNNQ